MVSYLWMVFSLTNQHNTQMLATRVLARTLRGLALEQALHRHHAATNYAELSYLCFQSLRHYYSLSERLQYLLTRPKETLDLEVWCALLVGACQLEFSKRPKPIVVFSVVEAIKQVGKTSASTLVNAVLRKYEPGVGARRSGAHHELPDWLMHRIMAQMDDLAPTIFEHCVQHAPMTLRINQSKISTSDFCRRLKQQQIAYRPTLLPHALNLTQPQAMSSIPGFDEGEFVVQDLASQLAVPLLHASTNDHILDACAHPGIKTQHIFDHYPTNRVTSADQQKRCSTWNNWDAPTEANQHMYVQADLTNRAWWDQVPYGRVLLDAPCSGTGTMRRHPDIKVKLTDKQLVTLRATQSKLLDNLWPVVAPKGYLVYCTCSILKEENDAIIEDFIGHHSDVGVIELNLPFGFKTTYGWQTIPDARGNDGFYFAKLNKLNN